MNLLGSSTPTAAVAQEVLGTSTSLVGKNSLTLIAAVSGLASGSTAVVYFQVPIDGVYYDIAALAFTTGTAAKQVCCSIQGVSAANTLTTLGLTDNTAIQGVVGDTVRAVLKTTGTYTAGSVKALYEAH